MSKAAGRPASGRKPGGANKDILNFLNTNKGASKLPQASGAPAFGRQDTGFSRASGDFSDRGYTRGGKTGTNFAAPGGASDYGDLGIPTNDRRDYG